MMIVVPDESQTTDVKAGLELAGGGAEEPPPTYSPPSEPPVGASGSGVVPPSTAFKTKPTNFLSLSNNHDGIRGEFVVDPTIQIPSSLLPPLGEDETEGDRKNLCLRSKSGAIRADIWLLGSEAPKPRRTSIALSSHHGSIHAELHTVGDTAPFSLKVDAPHGGVRLALPRSFQGMVSVSTRHGKITLSDALIQNAAQLSQVGEMRRYFVGDLESLGEDWQGDQVEIETTHGSIRVRYVDEDMAKKGKKGILDRLFGK